MPLTGGDVIDLPASAARHVQVLRLQPGAVITLFSGAAEGSALPGGEFDATVTRMGRSDVQVRIGAHHAIEREMPRAVHLLTGITANERMDWLVEKATELGAASLTPLLAERSVLKLRGERGDRKRAHWQAVAEAACEQCGRNRVPAVHQAVSLAQWLEDHPCTPSGEAQPMTRLVLTLQPDARALREAVPASGPFTLLSGPEGGLTPAEEAAAMAAGFIPVTLGPRVLRAETAPLAVLAALTLG
jgi:16S rRNA (uracil1498-N3)-methyltransferase